MATFRNNLVVYEGDNAGAGPSANVWKDLVTNPNSIEFFDDFNELLVSGSRYTRLEADGDASMAQLATDVGGVVRLTNSVITEEVALGQVVGLVKIVKDSGNKVHFEARIRTSSIADTVNGIFVGLFEEACAAANIQTDVTGALADKDYVCFRTLLADGDSLDIEHRTSGGSAVIVGDAATLVAATWIKVGFVFDGVNTITFYVNGVAVDTCSADDTDFPDGEELGLVIGSKVGANSALTLDIDWWKLVSER